MAIQSTFNMSPNRLRRSVDWVVFACVVAVAGGCSFQSFEYLKKGGKSSAEGGEAGGSGEGGTAGGLGGTTGESGASTGASAGTPGTAGRSATAGATSIPGGGSAGTAPSGSGGTTSAGAGNGATAGSSGTTVAPPSLGPFEFNAAADVVPTLWKMSGETTTGSAITWEAQGETEPLGAMLVTGLGLGNFYYDIPAAFTDQTARTKVNWRVKAVTAATRVKPYCTATGWIWVDGGEFQVTTTAWTTASISLVAPSYEGVGANGEAWTRAAVAIIGIQLPAAGTILVDRVWLD